MREHEENEAFLADTDKAAAKVTPMEQLLITARSLDILTQNKDGAPGHLAILAAAEILVVQIAFSGWKEYKDKGGRP